MRKNAQVYGYGTNDLIVYDFFELDSFPHHNVEAVVFLNISTPPGHQLKLAVKRSLVSSHQQSPCL